MTEECDYGLTSCEVCSALCNTQAGVTAYCGDGAVNGPEVCDDGDTVEIRIAKADKAMYCAKKTGKNRYVFNQSDL